MFRFDNEENNKLFSLSKLNDLSIHFSQNGKSFGAKLSVAFGASGCHFKCI